MTRLFYDFLVRWVQQLQWQSSSLTDVKDLFTQEVLPKSFRSYLPLLKDWIISPTESSLHLSSKFAGHEYRVFSCRCQPVTTGSLWDCETTTGIGLLRNVDGWRILSLANTSGCWLGRNLVADAVWLLPCKASGLRREWAKQGARLTFTTEFQIFAKLQEAFLLPACEWELLGSSRWGLQQQPFGRCCTAKSKQHLRHKQRMMIHPEWNQRSLSYGAIL